jgi:hypothetical protein
MTDPIFETNMFYRVSIFLILLLVAFATRAMGIGRIKYIFATTKIY